MVHTNETIIALFLVWTSLVFEPYFLNFVRNPTFGIDAVYQKNALRTDRRLGYLPIQGQITKEETCK